MKTQQMKGIKLVCFDIDGTLVDGNSWLFLAKGLGCSPSGAFDIFQRAKKKEISFAQAERTLTKLFQNSGNANRTFIQNLFNAVKPKRGAKALISYLKGAGYKIYFISGAIDMYAKSIAEKLKPDGFYANSTLEFDDDGFLQKIHYDEEQGELKVKQITRLIKQLGIGFEQVAFVGDSENDQEVFKITRHGIAVNSSDNELNKSAWRLVNSLAELKEIL